MFPQAQSLIVPAFSIFAVCVLAEVIYCRVHNESLYRLGDTICNLTCMVVGVLSQPLFFSITYGFLKFWEGLTVLHIPNNPATTLIAVVLTDFLYYWEHRLSHTTRFLWLFHEIHHSSRLFNFSTSFRIHWFSRLIGPFFLVPLVLIGFQPEQVVAFILLNLFYQFLLHTKTVGKLGFLEGIINTPSSHRVHHGRNKLYIDKNLGGILMIWDRLFGTYQAETEEPEYGTLGNFSSDNPLTVHFHLLPFWLATTTGLLGNVSFVVEM